MAPERRSTVEEIVLWEEEEDFGWRCRRHPSQPRYGVCPGCLKERLLRLCPECAHLRPCRCLAAAPSPSSSSSASSFSSIDLARSAGGGSRGVGREIGAVGPVSRLIESEPAFRRSRSVGMPLLLSRSVAASVYGDDAPASATRRERKGWAVLWPFRRSSDGRKESPAMSELEARLPRSRSVIVEVSRFPDSGIAGEAKSKGWGRYFPGRKKAFRHRKASTKVDQEVSPPV